MVDGGGGTVSILEHTYIFCDKSNLIMKIFSISKIRWANETGSKN